MLRRIYGRLKNNNILIRQNSQATEHTKESRITNEAEMSDIEAYSPKNNRSVLENLDEDISHVSSYLKPTFNFAAYINKSDTLQQLLRLGVNFHEIEKKGDAVPFVLGLKFDDIREHITLLSSLGIETERIGYIITKNPLILNEDLDNLKIRINYLNYKKFSDEMIKHIIKSNPFWLTHSTQQIDEQLGFFQNQFQLSGDQVRTVAVSCSKLITHNADKVKLNIFVIKEEMGFSDEELKKIILTKPSVFIRGQLRLLSCFEYLHKDMNIPLERIVDEPEILSCRKRRLMERHLFLVKLGKAQYDPKKPNYIALTTLVSGSDANFSTEVAKSSVLAYNAFLKSL